MMHIVIAIAKKVPAWIYMVGVYLFCSSADNT